MKIENEKFIATADFGKYLSINGWSLTSSRDSVFNIWESDDHPDYEVLQPLNPIASDFKRRVLDLIDVLSITQSKSTDSIISELNEASDDIIRIRVIHEDVVDGSIPFNDGVELFIKTKELLISSARSLIKAQKGIYGGKTPKIVSEYFDSLKLSQTEIGSYVLKIESPIFFTTSDQEDHCSIPFGRSVSERVVHSVSKLEQAVNLFKDNNNYRHFEEVVKYGVNASLCAAIIGLSGSNHNRSIEISIQPSPFANMENLRTKSIKICASDIPFIERARGYYSNQYSIPNYTLIGKVIKLARDNDFGHGIATIYERRNGRNFKRRTVECSLDEVSYNKAIDAHSRSLSIHLTGMLIISGRKTRLMNARLLKRSEKLILD
ncbi:hypothetical protein [Citrobacter sp. RHBSTW-00671]|uniref:hypothetical protein n=1 Tax=Citrobacter sp. RHBSTW-00671 TaxID=2742660 RepID=UPI0017AC93FE|nr:hypothetical protein [Citrobacter sp. RHBSTW-00671]MBA7967878.1 hypothetical protein [Citrobacter sp. RHBSTW-00671]HCJ6374176.1 hypothetical protein [Citrobacter freundii]